MSQEGETSQAAGGPTEHPDLLILEGEIHAFATRSSMTVKSRSGTVFHKTGRFIVHPNWLVGWEVAGIRRQIQVSVHYGGVYPEIKLYTNAWRDDNGALERRSTGEQPRRGYTLSLPIDRRLFRETMRYAKRDAEAIGETDLVRVSGLSPLQPWLKSQ